MNAFIILNTLLFLVAELELANKLIFIFFFFFFYMWERWDLQEFKEYSVFFCDFQLLAGPRTAKALTGC